MWEPLTSMLSGGNILRGAAIVALLTVIAALLIWVSVIDIKKQSITFWKMLIASSSIIICPLGISLFYSCCKRQNERWYMFGALLLWFFLLYLNIKLNHDRFMGRADVDLLSAIFSAGLMFSKWVWDGAEDAAIASVTITTFWWRALGFLLFGAAIYLVIFFIMVATQVLTKRKTLKQLMVDTRISVVPMFIPISIAVPYMIMVA